MSNSATHPEIPDDCQICLGSLSAHDKEYPLLCPSRCNGNICFNCSSHLVKMRKKSKTDDFHRDTEVRREEEVMTLCPKCQDDLSITIEDTFLMRKVLKMESVASTKVPDSELSAAELRFKHSVTPQHIEDAKNRLKQFQLDIENGIIISRVDSLKRKIRRKNRIDVDKNNATIPTGTGNNIMTKKRSSLPSSLSSKIMKLLNIDFFLGMREILSSDEQSFIAGLMTSGDVDKLIQATQILYELKRIQYDEKSKQNEKPSSSNLPSLSDSEKRALRMSMSMEERTKLEEIENYLLVYPLPRMPKYISLLADFDIFARHGKILKFRDDNWDGTVSDAYARVYTQQPRRMVEDFNQIDGSFESDFYVQHNEEGGFVNGSGTREASENRVLIYAARKQAAEMCEPGDIVTHFNGDEFRGDASDLRQLINELYLSIGDNSFSMILNAEQSTADALKDFSVELQKI